MAAAAIVVGAPGTVGPLAPEPNQREGPSAVADPVDGGWVRFAGPDGLRVGRVSEGGAATSLLLPPLLRSEARGEYIEIPTALPSGWLVTVDRFYPGGPAEVAECSESRDPPETCGELAVAELSPRGRWTSPQPLPGSRGRDAAAAEPVEAGHGRIELAWEVGAPEPPTIRVAVGRLGARLGRPRVVGALMRGEPEEEALDNYDGTIIVRGEFGKDGTEFAQHAIERRLYGDGRLGPPRFRHGPLIAEQGERLPLPGGGETYVFGESFWAGFAYRPPGSATYRRPHLFSKDAELGIQADENPQGHALIAVRAVSHSRSRLLAAEVSPRGALEATQVLEAGPADPDGGYESAAAIDPQGWELVLAAGAGNGISAHAAGTRCRRFSRTPLTVTGGAFPLLLAGARGVFHLVWSDHATDTLRTATVRVRCA